MLGNFLVALNHGVGARCVDQVDLAQPFHRQVHQQRILAADLLQAAVAVPQQLDLAGRGQHTFGQQTLAQHGVEKGRLARVELAHHDEQKQLVELVQRLLESAEIFIGRAQTDQQHAQVFQQAALAAQQLILFSG